MTVEARVAIRMDLQGQVVDRDISAGGLWILVEMHHSAGGRPRLLLPDGHMRKTSMKMPRLNGGQKGFSKNG